MAKSSSSVLGRKDSSFAATFSTPARYGSAYFYPSTYSTLLEALSRLASVMGKPLFLDQASVARPSAQFARICVEIEVKAGLSDRVQAKIESKLELI